MLKGIDVSEFNGAIDWAAVKASGKVDFAIIRSGLGWTDGDLALRRDKQFEANIKGCEANGIPYGIYHYSYCLRPENARKEAQYVVRLIQAAGAKPLYPIWLDLEAEAQIPLGKSALTGLALDWMDELERAGYYTGIYSYRSFLENYLDMDKLSEYDVWLAEVDVAAPKYRGEYGMWQYSWKGDVPGINGDVDLDYAYKDYPEIIKAKGLNGWANLSGGQGIVAPSDELESIKKELAAIIEKLIALQAYLKARE